MLDYIEQEIDFLLDETRKPMDDREFMARTLAKEF